MSHLVLPFGVDILAVLPHHVLHAEFAEVL